MASITQISGALAKVLALRGVTMTDTDGTSRMGLVPAEVATAIPLAVKDLSTGSTPASKTAETTAPVVDTQVVLANLVEAVRELNATVTNFTPATVTFAQLPAAATSKGQRRYISNANLGLLNLGAAFGAVAAGGGTVFAPVWCDGTTWRIG